MKARHELCAWKRPLALSRLLGQSVRSDATRPVAPLAIRILRPLMRLVPAGARLPVATGPLRGAWWIVDASPGSCWFGTYELEHQRFLQRRVRPGDSVLDVGAHVGFFTLLLARLVGSAGRVVAIEPLPENRDVLERHLHLNHVENVKVLAAAAGARPGVSRFTRSPWPCCAQFSESGEIEVRVVAVDELIAAKEMVEPSVIKIDVEGAEEEVLLGAGRVLGARHPSLLIATHGWRAHGRCLRLVRECGYNSIEEWSDESSGNGAICATGGIG